MPHAWVPRVRMRGGCGVPAGKYRGIWTGKQLMSMIIPDVNLHADTRLDETLNPKDEVVIVDRVRVVHMCVCVCVCVCV